MRIVLVNAHWNNRGDEAALYALITSIYKIDTGIKISIIFKETARVGDFLYEGRIPYITTRFRPKEEQVKKAIKSGKSDNNDIAREMDFIRMADLVIYAPGGAVISDRFWWEKQMEYIFPIAYAQSIGIQTVFAAPSAGPFSDEHKFRNDVLRNVNTICLRESIGVCFIEEIVGETDNLILSNDLAFLRDIDMIKESKELEGDKSLNDFLRRYRCIVGITITNLSWNVGYLSSGDLPAQIKTSFQKFINWLGKNQIGAVLIPQLFGEQNDTEYLEGFKTENTFILSNEYNSDFQQYLVSKLYAVVGLRYHSNIFAAKMGIPMIPIVYEQKMEGFLLDSGIKNWGIDVKEVSFHNIKTAFEEMQAEYEKRKKLLENKNTGWKARSQKTVDIIKKYVANLK